MLRSHYWQEAPQHSQHPPPTLQTASSEELLSQWVDACVVHTPTTVGHTPVQPQVRPGPSNSLLGVVTTMWCTPSPVANCPDRPQYVGMVGSTRLDNTVGEHFNLPGHSVEDITFLPFERVMNRDPFVIEARESHWISKYRGIDCGLNKKQ